MPKIQGSSRHCQDAGIVLSLRLRSLRRAVLARKRRAPHSFGGSKPPREKPAKTLASGCNRRRARRTALNCFYLIPLPIILASHHPSRSAWVQITHFSDSATSPAFSLDGRMMAFIRSPETFVTPGQVYVKALPDGQPVQLTHDDLPKMAPVFFARRIAHCLYGHRRAIRMEHLGRARLGR